MWILKGTLLGLWLFGFGTIAYLYLMLFRHLEPNTAVAVSSLVSLTTFNPFWWAGLVVCLILGFVVARSWAGPKAVWITLLVTGLVPVGALALFLVLIYKLKQASQG